LHDEENVKKNNEKSQGEQKQTAEGERKKTTDSEPAKQMVTWIGTLRTPRFTIDGEKI